MPKYGKEMMDAAISAGINLTAFVGYFQHPESTNPQVAQKIKRAIEEYDVVRNEIAGATSSKKLHVFAVFGNVKEYISALQKYSEKNLFVAAIHETPDTILRKYYCTIFLFFEEFPDPNGVLNLDRQAMIANCKTNQNLFDEVVCEDEDTCVHLMVNLLKFHNSLYPFKVRV